VCWVELQIEGQPPMVAVQHQVELVSGQEASTKQREVRPIATETQTLRQVRVGPNSGLRSDHAKCGPRATPIEFCLKARFQPFESFNLG